MITDIILLITDWEVIGASDSRLLLNLYWLTTLLADQHKKPNKPNGQPPDRLGYSLQIANEASLGRLASD